MTCHRCHCKKCRMARDNRRARNVEKRDRVWLGSMHIVLSPQEGYSVKVPDVRTLKSMIDAGLRLHRQISPEDRQP